jgi:glycosyltransferase involved in cell wall biosynthesis
MQGKEAPLSIVHVITGLRRGGAEIVLLQLCLASQGGDWRHTVVSLTGKGEMGASFEEAGIPVIALDMKSVFSGVSGLWRLRGILRSLEPDIVQTWMYHANLIGGVASKLAGAAPLIWGIRSSVTDSLSIKRSIRVLVSAGARLSRALPARIVVCAHAAAESHVQAGYPSEKMTVIPNGIDTVRFNDYSPRSAELRSSIGRGRDLPLLGMVARFTPQKDHKNLFSALRVLADRGEAFQCVLVGNAMDGANRQLEVWIDEFDLRDRIVLMGPRDDLPEVMCALDLHVLSSAVEGFPNVLAEAMACGTPCVSTDAGDSRSIVSDTGWVVPKGDPVALTAAIQAALTERRESPEVWQNRRLACRKHIQEEFSLQRMVDEYVRVWRAVVAIR